MKAKEVIITGRKRKRAPSVAASSKRHAVLALLLGELDDQDAVLGCEPDQHHHADLRIKIERQTAEHYRGESPEHADRHRQQHRHRNDPALIERDEEQIGEQEREAENDARLAFRALLLERGVRPFAREALRQRFGGHLLHRGQRLSGRDARRRRCPAP